MKRAALLATAALALASAPGCGPQFDPSSEVTTLRVLGVKKDKPYAQPGDTVNLQLLWHDPKGRSDVQRLFIGSCVNPPGDLYYGCFAQYGELLQQGKALDVGTGDNFQVTLPADIISGRQGPTEPGQPRYGVYIVFFAVCAGDRLDIAADVSADPGSTGLPLRCLDDQDQPLGSEDFVVGYSTIYSFEGASNENPSFSVDNESGKGEFLVAGKPVVADCVGEECQVAATVDVDCSAEPERCVKPCEDDGDATCPAIEVEPAIDQNVEQDTVSSMLFGTNVTEQMWINYYVDHGSISEVRLLNDSTTGWNEKYRGKLRAPKNPGLLQLWSVAHDNRGGMDFARVTLRVEE
jgi:hypothetical protein